MKVEILVEREKLVINVDGFELDVYKDLENDIVEDPVKKSIWFSGVAYEVERRYFRFMEIEFKECQSFWRYWATRWLKAQDMKDTGDNVEAALPRLFSSTTSVNDKVTYLYHVLRKVRPQKSYEKWDDFFNDGTIDKLVKNECEEMYRIEFERKQTYDRMVETGGRMLSMAKTLKAVAEGYREKLYQEGRINKL